MSKLMPMRAPLSARTPTVAMRTDRFTVPLRRVARWMRCATLCLLAPVVASGAAASMPPVDEPMMAAREIAAPPEDLLSGRLRLGDPGVIESTHALIPVLAAPDRDRAAVRLSIPHPGGAAFTIAVAMSGGGPWAIVLRAPDGRNVIGPDGAVGKDVRVLEGNLGSLLGVDRAIPVTRFDVADAPAGLWSVEITGSAALAGSPGVVLVGDRSDLVLRAQFEDWIARVGVPRVLALDAVRGTESAPLTERTVVVRESSGATLPVTLLEGGVAFTPRSPGRHVLQAQAMVPLEGDRRAIRSVELVFEVAASAATLAGRASTEAMDGVRDAIRLPLEDGVVGESMLVGAEVWASSADGDRPVCWIAAIGQAARTGAAGEVAVGGLTLDRRWLGRAAVSGAPLHLRDVRIHDRETGAVLDRIPRIDLGVAPLAAPFDERELSSMLRGRTGGHAVPTSVDVGSVVVPANDAAAGSHALMLVHGYCTDATPFPVAHFTGDVGVFLDPNAARSNDQFAQLIAAYGATFKSYGTVGHSQGGLASLHLYTFYWSGLDWATGPRLIQSVGSPYQGTPLAGNLAVLGGIFGVGCGAVTDMTPDGATAWLSTIPTWARQRVHYWTTSYKDYPFSYDYCDFVSDLFLSNPDDGVIEKSKGQLPGGNSMGHAEGWCHTADMEDPPQCTDPVRNAQMNSNAAR